MESTTMTLGLALLGTGRIAANAFVPAVNAVEGTDLVAVLSRDQDRGADFARQHGIPKSYDDLDALLENPDVDGVIVATPDAMHETQVIAAVQAGKHVLCEKPLTATLAGCERIAEAVRASDVTFAMGYNNRFNTGLRHIKALLDADEIGPLRYARALLTTAAQDPEDWRAQSEQARYWAMSAVGTHVLDCWRWFFGEPASVGGVLAGPKHQGPNDEMATMVLNYPGRMIAEFTVSSLFLTPSRIEIYGENGSIIGTDVFGANPSGPITCRGRDIAYAPQNPFVLEIEDFVGAVRDQRPPCTTLDDGLLNVRIMETARDGVLQLPLG
jgi:1,5-anhydro-D-fructose reductase (1,5-anhydro-D-mannitol-forming)